VPKRIEVYDNSHIMGTNATGAMIVAGPEGFRKNSYRKFNIKKAAHRRRLRDDARGAGAALRPAGEGRSRPLQRRVARPAADRRRQGQLSPCCEIMEDAGVHDVPVVGVAKGRTTACEGARCSTCRTGAS
jgi:excinuclease ABC subunit C